MGILRTDRVAGLGGANAIKGSVKFVNGHALEIHPNSADFRLGSNNFTIEFWGNTIGTGNAIIFGLFENSPARRSYTFETRANRALRFECWSDGSSSLKNLTSSTGVWELSTWHYFTVVRNGTALNIYVDGTSVANTTFDNASDSLYENTVEPLILGASKQSNVFYGNHGSLYISNFRLTNGTALYTGNFTPPNRELTKLSTTNVLCCQSSGDVLKEETGKILVTSTNDTNSAPPQASKFTPNSPVGFSTTTDVGSQYGTTFDGFGSFATSTYMVPPGGNTRERNRGRGVFAGGDPGVNNITFIQIQSQGNSQDFGDLSQARIGPGAVGSSTRGVIATGYVAPANVNTMDFITIANTANAIDFGDSSASRHEMGSASNETRGLFAGGTLVPNDSDTIDFITIATAGDATDFGNLSVARRNLQGVNSSTRAVFAGGRVDPSGTAKNDIDYVEIATTGNAADFGDLTVARGRMGAVCSSTRGVFAGGNGTNHIDYITIASTGNAIDFGDVTQNLDNSIGGCSNKTRGVFNISYTSPAIVNAMQFVTIATTGNSQDFGDQTSSASYRAAAFSDSHGGLS